MPREHGHFTRALACAGAIAALGVTTSHAQINFMEHPDPLNGRFTNPVVIGDITGDGFSEILVSNADADSNEGRVHIYSGEDFSLLRTIEPPTSGSNQFFGASNAAWSGHPTVDHTVIVSAFFANEGQIMDAGRVYIFDPNTGDLLHTLSSPNAETGGQFGSAVISGLDYNGDSVDDIFVGAVRENSEAGRVYVFSGDDYSLLETLEAPTGAMGFGTAFYLFEDFTNDSILDLFVVSQLDTVSGQTNAGRIYLYSGDDLSLVQAFESPDPTQDAFLNAVFRIGDITGGGTEDFALFSAPNANPFVRGRLDIFSGETLTLIDTLTPDPAEFTAGDYYFGLGAAPLPDINNDGTTDFVIGISGAAGPIDGEARIVSGDDFSVIQSITPVSGFNPTGFGFVHSLADINSNGFEEFGIGYLISSNGMYVFGPDATLSHTGPGSFGTISVESTIGRSRTISLTNNGFTDITFDGTPVTITGDHADDFTITSPLTETVLAPGESDSMTVLFLPEGTGPRTATLNVFSNAAESPLEIELAPAVGRQLTPPGPAGVAYVTVPPTTNFIPWTSPRANARW